MSRKRLSKTEREQILAKTNGHCAYCGCELTLKTMQADHIHSLYTGGSNELDNYLPACRSCNFYKDTMTIEAFREQISLIPKRLNENIFIYRIALKFGLVKEISKPIKFYFEEVEV